MEERTREAVRRHACRADDRVKAMDADIAFLETQLAQAKNDRAVVALDAQTFRDLLQAADKADSVNHQFRTEMPPSMVAYAHNAEPFTEEEVQRIVCGLTL